jgi:hypothetical protein
MDCPICAGLQDLTDLTAPYVIKTCAGCGRKINLRQPGEGGKGIRVDKGDQLVIPADFIQIALNPLKAQGPNVPGRGVMVRT